MREPRNAPKSQETIKKITKPKQIRPAIISNIAISGETDDENGNAWLAPVSLRAMNLNTGMRSA